MHQGRHDPWTRPAEERIQPSPRLLEAARAGDAAAFAALVDPHRERLIRILRRSVGDDADDVLQETLLRAWSNLDRFEGRSGLFTWLTRIAFNEAHRSRTRRAGPPTVPLDDALGERVPGWGNRPDERFATREFLEALERALRDLPEDFRTAVVLRDLEGFSTAEAAAALGIEPAALKSRLHRGRMALRRALDGHFAAG